MKGGAPANIEDLKALFLDDLADARRYIRHSNLDKYKVYWSGRGSALGKPRDEDFCRDRLVEYLRGRLVPMGLWIEPEGHMAADKRADIVVFAPHGLKLPVEVKRDMHRELWVAAKEQLERLYARDPSGRIRSLCSFLFWPRQEMQHPATSGRGRPDRLAGRVGEGPQHIGSGRISRSNSLCRD